MGKNVKALKLQSQYVFFSRGYSPTYADDAGK